MKVRTGLQSERRFAGCSRLPRLDEPIRASEEWRAAPAAGARPLLRAAAARPAFASHPGRRALEVGSFLFLFSTLQIGAAGLNRGDRKCASHRRVPRESTPEVATAGESFRRLRYGGHPPRLLAAAQRLLGDQVRGSPRGGAGGGHSEPGLVCGVPSPAGSLSSWSGGPRAGVDRRCPRGAAAGRAPDYPPPTRAPVIHPFLQAGD